MARKRSQENDNGYEEPTLNLKEREHESYHSVETAVSGVNSEWS